MSGATRAKAAARSAVPLRVVDKASLARAAAPCTAPREEFAFFRETIVENEQLRARNKELEAMLHEMTKGSQPLCRLWV